MQSEVELKFRVTDFEEVRIRLRNTGAANIRGETPEVNTIFDSEARSLAGKGTLLRLRQYGDETILTVKEPRQPGSMKIRIEHETQLSISMNEAFDLLGALGYTPVYRYEKTREIWSLSGGVKVCLDRLHFGAFIEIEADCEEKVRNTAELLGFRVSEGLSESYSSLEKGCRKGH